MARDLVRKPEAPVPLRGGSELRLLLGGSPHQPAAAGAPCPPCSVGKSLTLKPEYPRTLRQVVGRVITKCVEGFDDSLHDPRRVISLVKSLPDGLLLGLFLGRRPNTAPHRAGEKRPPCAVFELLHLANASPGQPHQVQIVAGAVQSPT